jgi:hypothetical protein
MDETRQPQQLTELVHEAVEKGATSVEEIHRAIADLPLDILERLELFEGTVTEVRRVQDQTLGAIYDLIRGLNDEVSKIASEALQVAKAS